MTALPPTPMTRAVKRALVIGDVRAGGAAVAELVVQRLGAGADLVAISGAAVPGALTVSTDQIVLDLGPGPGVVAVDGARAVAGTVDRWDDATVDAVIASGSTVLVGCSAAGTDDDPALPRALDGFERSVQRLLAAGLAVDRVALDATAAPGASTTGVACLLKGHHRVARLGHPTVASVPPPTMLLEVAAALARPALIPADEEAALVAVASALVAAGARGIRTTDPAIVRRVATVFATIEERP